MLSWLLWLNEVNNFSITRKDIVKVEVRVNKLEERRVCAREELLRLFAKYRGNSCREIKAQWEQFSKVEVSRLPNSLHLSLSLNSLASRAFTPTFP
jgi:hypothetical protein